MTNQEFIDQIAGYVKKYAAIFGICVHSPIIAQAILESGWGESKLAANYHNYFGLKCGTKWTGKSVNMNTQEEYEPGVLTMIADNFRVFDSMEDGVKGYFEFIQLDIRILKESRIRRNIWKQSKRMGMRPVRLMFRVIWT